MYRCDTSLYLRYADERGCEIGRGVRAHLMIEVQSRCFESVE